MTAGAGVLRDDLQLAYLGLEVLEPGDLGTILGDVVGLVPGDPVAGSTTWRNDGGAHRLIVERGPADDATLLGIEAADAAAFDATARRLAGAGFPLEPGTADERAARRVADLACTTAPWGMRVELVRGLAQASTPFASTLVPGGFLTAGVGFGHVVFATTAFDESHAFITEGLGMVQSDWIETEVAPGIELEARFYHCNRRHHSIAIARAPVELAQRMHHFMVETNQHDDVGRAFDRAWAAGLSFASGLGRHDNDGMFSFYLLTPAGFQIEVGHGGRLIGDDWTENRRYHRISAWGHQPLATGGTGGTGRPGA